MATIGGKYNDYSENISTGKLGTHTVIFHGGYCSDIGLSYMTLNPLNLTSIVFPSAATVMKISSSSANDTAAGTGLRTVKITGLLSTYDEASEIVTLNGQTSVNTVNSYLRVNELLGLTSGSAEEAVGTVYCGSGTVTAGVPAVIYSYIFAGENLDQIPTYTVPLGYKFLLSNVFLSQANNTASDVYFSLETRLQGGLFIPTARGPLASSGQIIFDPKLSLDEKTDFRIRVKDGSSTSGAWAIFIGYLRAKSLDV